MLTTGHLPPSPSVQGVFSASPHLEFEVIQMRLQQIACDRPQGGHPYDVTSYDIWWLSTSG